MKGLGLVFITCIIVITEGIHDCGSGHSSGQGCECHDQIPKDCTDIKSNGQSKSGVYTIQPSTFDTPFYVYCDMETDGGGWTVFQRRLDGSVGFFRGWNDYREGFGNVNSEFWLGNEKIFYLTAQGSYELRVDLSDFDGESRYAAYDYFRIGDEENLYKLFLGGYTGDAADSLDHHRDKYFTTKDSDNDDWDNNCAVAYSGAWWYGECHHSNLNGLYLEGEHESFRGWYQLVYMAWA